MATWWTLSQPCVFKGTDTPNAKCLSFEMSAFWRFLKFRMHITDQKTGSRTWKQLIPVMFPTALDSEALKRAGRNHKARPGGSQNPCQKRLFLGSNHRLGLHTIAQHTLFSPPIIGRFRAGPDEIVGSLYLLLFSGFPSRSVLVFVMETLSPPVGADG